MRILWVTCIAGSLALGQSFELPQSQDHSAPQPLPTEKAIAPIDAAGRAKWVVHSSFGPVPFASLIVEAGIETWRNDPREFGTHWSGYGQRVGSKIATSVLSNSMEASLGAIWGEDPRYTRSGLGSARRRVKHALLLSVLAQDDNGGMTPAYARYVAITSSRFLSNTWLPESQESFGSTASRIGLAFVRRAAGNTFKEFWPDVRSHIRRQRPVQSS